MMRHYRQRHRARKASIGGGLSNEAVRFLSDEFPSNDDRRLFNKTPSSWTEQDIEMLEGMMSYLSEEWFLLGRVDNPLKRSARRICVIPSQPLNRHELVRFPT